jgi:Flp pilus assembly protein TadG
MAGRLNRHLRGRQRGDAIVEFILVVPILLLILFGIMELGRVLDAWIIVQNAAREGARSGALASPASGAGTAAQAAANAYLSTAFSSRTDVDGEVINPAVVSSDAVSLTVEADIHIYTPFMQAILASSVPVRATAVMPR